MLSQGNCGREFSLRSPFRCLVRYLVWLSRYFRLEAELNTSLVSEIALVVVAVCKGIAKAGQHIVNLCRPDSDVFAKRNVDTSADNEVKRIVAGRLTQGSTANGNTILVQISVKIAVRSTEWPQQMVRNAKSGILRWDQRCR